MQRLNTVTFSHFPKRCEYSVPPTPDSKYVVDDSNFIPMKEAIKQLNRVPDPSREQIEQVYDFPNGVDNGKPIPVTRTHNFGDIAELSVAVNEQMSSMSQEIMKGKSRLAIQKETEAQVKAISEAHKSTTE